MQELMDNQFRVALQNDERVKRKAERQFNNDKIPVILLDEESRAKNNLPLGSTAKVTYKNKKVIAGVNVQFSELIGLKTTTVNSIVEQKLGVSMNDIVEIGEPSQEEKETFQKQITALITALLEEKRQALRDRGIDVDSLKEAMESGQFGGIMVVEISRGEQR